MPRKLNANRGMKKQAPERPRAIETLAVAAILALIAATSIFYFYSRGDILAYGDAEAHLNIARKLWDNRQPSYREIGTVWLPVPHLLMLPFTWFDSLYRSGLAGSIPTSLCWIAAGVLLYAAIRRLAGSWEPAACAVAIFALNPNLLYLAATPMNEPVFYMAIAGVLHALALYRDSPRTSAVLAAILWTWCAALTRYEGWLLIPVASLFFLMHHSKHAATYAIAASLAPLYIFGHNWWIYGDPLEFYRGEWSPRAIYDRTHTKGFQPFPGEGNLPVAFAYYRTAAEIALGTTAFWIAALGLLAVFWKRWYWFALLLIAAPAFTIWGMRSGAGVEIFVPTLWPHSYYNSRYALALLPLAALGGAALVAIAPRLRGTVALCIGLVAVAPWLIYMRSDNWIVWKEGQVNSVERRAWTHQMAAILAPAFRPGDRILYAFGDLTGVLREARVPLRAGLQSGNELEWVRTLARPDLFLDQDWVLDFEDGKAAAAANARRNYKTFARIPREHNAPAVVLLYRSAQ